MAKRKISVKHQKKKEVVKETVAKEKRKEQGIFFNQFMKPSKKKEVATPKKNHRRLQRISLLKRRQKRLDFFLKKAGYEADPSKIRRIVLNITLALNVIITLYFLFQFSTSVGFTTADVIISITSIWTILFAVVYFTIWIAIYTYLDLKVYGRKVAIEAVLPDFLQLTASNIKAGMTVDRALWYAVRPRFGVLAKEIETVAKETMKGDDLKVSLQRFADKYDSPMLKRSISLLIEGIDSGGEIGSLLNKISLNIQENKIMRREMSANVTTYVIFISFATLAAAPALFSLSGVLIKVITSLGTQLGDVASTGGGTIGFSFKGAGIQYSDFRIFAIVSLLITSFFSSAIIATISKGNIKAGFKYIPIFIVVSITLFLVADFFLDGVLGVIF